MSNTLLTSSIIAKGNLAVIENNCAFGGMVNRDYETEQVGSMRTGYEPGATLNIRKPSRYTYRSGRTSVPQASVDTTIPLTLSQGGADLNFNLLSGPCRSPIGAFRRKSMPAPRPSSTRSTASACCSPGRPSPNRLNPTGALPATQAEAVAAITSINRRPTKWARHATTCAA